MRKQLWFIGLVIAGLAGCVSAGSKIHEQAMSELKAGNKVSAMVHLSQGCDQESFAASCYELAHRGPDAQKENHLRRACDLDTHLQACVDLGKILRAKSDPTASVTFKRACEASHQIVAPQSLASHISELTQDLEAIKRDTSDNVLLAAAQKATIVAGEQRIRALKANPAEYNADLPAACEVWKKDVDAKLMACKESGGKIDDKIVESSASGCEVTAH